MPLTKIVCTLGPATDDPETIRAMIQAGMTVARLNFSHGTADEKRSCRRDGPRGCGSGGASRRPAGRPAGPEDQNRQGPEGWHHSSSRAKRSSLPRGKITDPHRESPFPTRTSSLTLWSGDRLLIDDGTLELSVLQVDAGADDVSRLCRGEAHLPRRRQPAGRGSPHPRPHRERTRAMPWSRSSSALITWRSRLSAGQLT